MIAPLLIDKVVGNLDTEITGISYDSRQVFTGNLFVCIRGENSDGHRFVTEAINRGARAILAERYRLAQDKVIEIINSGLVLILCSESKKALATISAKYYDYPTDKLRVIGVTGTDGKTTTTHLIDKLISRSYNQKTGLIGTVSAYSDTFAEEFVTTTPESCDLQKFFSKMVLDSCPFVTLEVSSHAIVQNRILGTEFDIAVFTNLSQDHLDFHGTMGNYRLAKGKLFSQMGLKPEKNGRSKCAVINHDDQNASFMVEQTAVPVVTYGFDNCADIRGEILEATISGTTIKITSVWGEFVVSTTLTGEFNCYNILAAVTVALIEGVPISKIQKILSQAIKIPGRMEKVEQGQEFLVLVDYAHTPESLKKVLQTIRRLMVDGKVGVVFGCGGERDAAKRPAMAKVTSQHSDKLFITSDNPRSEPTEQIICDILSGLSPEKRAQSVVEPDRKKAIHKALDWAEENDIVLIAGKGHETYQVFKDQVYEFDDRHVASQKLAKMGYNNDLDWT